MARKRKLCTKLEKFYSMMDLVQYLGYIIDEQGVHVDQANIQFTHDYKSLTTLIDLRSFLGIFYFSHKLMLGLYHITWNFIQVSKGREK